MQVKVFDPVLPPEAFVADDVERCAKDAALDRFFQIGGIGFGPFQQAAIGQAGVKASLGQAGADNVVLRDVFFF